MPVVETPFFTELRPLEVLSVAVTPDADASKRSFQSNAFSSMVTCIILEEQAGEGAPEQGKHPSGAGQADRVRVSLVATLKPPAEATEASAAPLTITLASHIFAAPAPSARPSFASAGGDQIDVVASTLVTLRTPLFFSSNGPVASLTVVAHRVVDGEKGKGGNRMERAEYSGTRQFTIRLIGVQQTVLTREQVLLLANSTL